MKGPLAFLNAVIQPTPVPEPILLVMEGFRGDIILYERYNIL